MDYLEVKPTRWYHRVGYGLFMVCIVCFVVALEPKKQRYHIKQSEIDDECVVSLKDNISGEQITLVNSEKDGGASIIFYPPGDDKPSFIISRRGFQARDKTGKARFVSIDEILTLDRSKTIADDEEFPDTEVPSIADQWNIDSASGR